MAKIKVENVFGEKRFSELEFGEAFEFRGDFFIKSGIWDSNTQEAINLDTWEDESFRFEDDPLVIPRTAKLIINE